MMYLFFSILIILIGFLVVKKHQKGNISNRTECSICNQTFNENEVFVVDEMPFCQEHFYTYKNNEWLVFKEVKSTPENSEDGVKIYEYKLKLFHQNGIPSIIKPSYEIDGEQIRTVLQLLVTPSDLDRIKKGPQ